MSKIEKAASCWFCGNTKDPPRVYLVHSAITDATICSLCIKRFDDMIATHQFPSDITEGIDPAGDLT